MVQLALLPKEELWTPGTGVLEHQRYFARLLGCAAPRRHGGPTLNWDNELPLSQLSARKQTGSFVPIFPIEMCERPKL